MSILQTVYQRCYINELIKYKSKNVKQIIFHTFCGFSSLNQQLNADYLVTLPRSRKGFPDTTHYNAGLQISSENHHLLIGP